MDNDELVRRVWERDRLGHEAAESDALNELRSSRRAAYAVLADIRRNIPALVNANEVALKPLLVHTPGLVDKRVQTAGWLLYRRSEGEGYYSHYHLLADGRLAKNFQLVSDESFWDWVKSGQKGIGDLYQRADLPIPRFPALESYSQAKGLSHEVWQRLYREVREEPLPEPPSGVRFYTDADFRLAPPPPPEKRSWLGFRR